MKKTYFKYLFSSFKNDLTRILAIFLIVFLGVGFVVGLITPGCHYKAKKGENVYAILLDELSICNECK